MNLADVTVTARDVFGRKIRGAAAVGASWRRCRVFLLWRLLRDHGYDINKVKLWPLGALEWELLIKDYVAYDPFEQRRWEAFVQGCRDAQVALGKTQRATEQMARSFAALRRNRRLMESGR